MISVEDLDISMVQITEMLASLMDRKAMKSEIETKLGKAFATLMKEAYPESGRFFMTKNTEIDVLDLTYHASKAIKSFTSNSDVEVKKFKGRMVRDYFLTKV